MVPNASWKRSPAAPSLIVNAGLADLLFMIRKKGKMGMGNAGSGGPRTNLCARGAQKMGLFSGKVLQAVTSLGIGSFGQGKQHEAEMLLLGGATWHSCFSANI